MANVIKCGNCKGVHQSVRQVRECYGHVSPTAQHAAQQEQKAQHVGQLATAKQVAFARKLCAERPMWADVMNYHHDAIPGFTKAMVSQIIEQALGMDKETSADTSAEGEREDGIYRCGTTYYKLYHTVHGQNVQVAKELVIHEPDCGGCANGEPCGAGCKWTHSWEYRGKDPLKLTLVKLSQEEAAEFGKVYGFCVRCGRDLTREESLFVGYGKTCAGHEGWWYPTKKELQAMTAAATPVAATV